MLEENMIRWRNSVQTEAREEGRVEGRVEGRLEGRLEGMQRLLLKQLKLRFGPLPLPVRRQIREISSMAELEGLAGRLLPAASLWSATDDGWPRASPPRASAGPLACG
jgi:hypothetical protein